MRVRTAVRRATFRPATDGRRPLAAAVALVLALGSWPVSSRAEMQISVYGGANENFSSRATLDKAPASESRTMNWDGKSFEMPPYWGVRGTYWRHAGSSWGVALDYTHAKAYADLNFSSDATYNRLEFTDGLNLLTLNLMYRLTPSSPGSWFPTSESAPASRFRTSRWS